MRNGNVEDMLMQLIKTVGNIQTDLQTIKADITDMKAEMTDMKHEIARIETKNDLRHHEVMRQISRLQSDHDYTWKKTVHHEREIESIKRHMS